MSHRLQIQYRELERRAKQIKELHPLIDVENGELVGGLYCPSDGSIDPTGMGYVLNCIQHSRSGLHTIQDCP